MRECNASTVGTVRRSWLAGWASYALVITLGIGTWATLRRFGIGPGLSAYPSIAAGLMLIVLLEKWIPYRGEWRPMARELGTDWIYHALVQAALPAALGLVVSTTLAREAGARPLVLGAPWPHGASLAAEFLVMLLLADGFRYALHVTAHRFSLLWRLHAVHHAPAKLYALNVGRFHPLERTLQYMAETLPFALLGVREEVLALYVLFHSLHGFFQHANIDVHLGVLNYVLSGPELHRWHHSRIRRESNANYANHLAVWDVLFGTYHLPAGEAVSELGLRNPDYPQTFRDQLRTPFNGALDEARGPLLRWRDVVLNPCLRLHMAFVRRRAWRPLLAATQRPRAAQFAVLRRILTANRATQFGREHGFAEIAGIADFRRRVPMQTYESLSPYIDSQERTGAPFLTADRPVLYAQTSGTTGAPRHFPLSRRALAQHKRSQDLFAYVQYRGEPGAYDGRILAIVSPAVEGRLPSGTPFGAISGSLYRAMPRLAQLKYVLPPEVFEVSDYELKYLLILRLALAEENVTGMATANPSTFLRLLSVLREHRAELMADLEQSRFARLDELPSPVRRVVESRLCCGRRRLEELRQVLARADVSFADLWPHLRLVSTWTGGSCGIALKTLRALIPSSARVVDPGYLASEFRGSITIDAASSAGVPTLQENFFEFVEKERWENGEPEFRLLDELEIGREYYVVVTTSTGLYRYFINDMVRATGRFHATPTIAFMQKGKGVTTITGEKLYESQVLEAVHAAEAEVGETTRFFVMLADVEKARYQLFVECDARFRPDGAQFAARVDALLGERNIEYHSKRASGRLAPLELCPMREGFGEAYRAWCVGNGQRDGQFKTIALQYVTDFRFDYTAWMREDGAHELVLPPPGGPSGCAFTWPSPSSQP
jgi:sterol desaturase/sphingolipid hydroxylase (fatty acid hydroxylase superfamily)